MAEDVTQQAARWARAIGGRLTEKQWLAMPEARRDAIGRALGLVDSLQRLADLLMDPRRSGVGITRVIELVERCGVAIHGPQTTQTAKEMRVVQAIHLAAEGQWTVDRVRRGAPGGEALDPEMFAKAVDAWRKSKSGKTRWIPVCELLGKPHGRWPALKVNWARWVREYGPPRALPSSGER